ncbi:MAG: translocation/assembly module TamB domain-containing protein, partial [Acidobacteria bacterium]|nr:translocation/assembly module TamB domain-containing protein [Acidobacteriota bacterium]
ALSPEASGALQAKGRVTGTRDAPRIVATFNGSALGFGTRKVTLLSGAADVDLAPSGALDVSLLATGVAWDPGFRPAEEVKLTAKGRSGSHTLTLEAGSPDGSISTVLAGGLDRARTAWTGELRKLDVSTKTAGSWKLEGVAALHASAKRSTLEGFCFASQGGRLCASGSYGEGAFDVDARAERLPLTLLGPFLPENVTITGLLEGTAKARGRADGSLSADVDLRPGPGEIRIPGRGKAQQSVAYRDAALTLKADGQGLHAVAGTLIAETGRVSVDLTFPRFAERTLKTKEQPVSGRVLFDLPRLDVIQGFVEEFREVKGSLKADLALGGTLGSPTVRGEAALVGGGATVPGLGIRLEEFGLVARGDGTGPLRFEGSLVSGGGKLRIEGETPVTPGALTATVVRLTGENVELLNQPPENRIVGSPRLTITLLGSRVDVTGEVEVPRAKYERKSAFATVRVSPDVVIVSRDPATTAEPEAIRELHARVRLILGDDVRLKASGLDTKITGSLLAIEQPGKRTIATGELELREGTYKAYGQDLRIERGRLAFGGGPIDNPGIDARASRKARDGTVAGLVIKGTLRNPETTVFSDPPMGQADALAYILLGHPLNEATQEEGSLVTNAVGSLGIKGGNLLMKQLAGKFGLEEARIETEGTFREASLIVGKYLSPRIYVEYGIGLFTRASTLRVSYILNKQWTVRAETGAANAGDIFYTIEK